VELGTALQVSACASFKFFGGIWSRLKRKPSLNDSD
jgi:hypothetical protein